MIFFLAIHIIWEFTIYGLQEKMQLWILLIYFMLIGNGKVQGLYLEFDVALPMLARAVNSHFTVSVLINSRFPVFLLCERRKAGNCRNTADEYGGNPAKRFFRLLFASFTCWWVTGLGLVHNMMEGHV